MNAQPRADCVPIAQLADRSVGRVCGRITAIQVEPSGAAPSLMARIQDDSGTIDVVFMGRRAVPGIEPGQHVEVEGRVAGDGAAARIYNPRYELKCLT